MSLLDITNNFKSTMIPFQNLAMDESLVLWKGRLSYKQFIKTKRYRFGIKLFVICDVETDFILDILVYAGSTTEYKETDSNLGLSGVVVNILIKPYLKKYHKLYYICNFIKKN